jgi:hypothetical protein
MLPVKRNQIAGMSDPKFPVVWQKAKRARQAGKNLPNRSLRKKPVNPEYPGPPGANLRKVPGMAGRAALKASFLPRRLKHTHGPRDRKISPKRLLPERVQGWHTRSGLTDHGMRN